MNALYQIVILDPAASGIGDTLRATLRSGVSELGLNPDDHLRFLGEGNYKTALQSRDPLVCAYFGGAIQTNGATQVLQDVLSRFAFVLPVVDSTESFSRKVPECLHTLNGASIEAADTKLERVAGRLLEELRLVRRRRMAFVSYRRTESRGVGCSRAGWLMPMCPGSLMGIAQGERGLSLA